MRKPVVSSSFIAMCLLLFSAACSSGALRLRSESDRTAQLSRKSTDDLDKMVQRRLIRVLTAFSRTQYFVDQGVQRGLAYDTAKLFEEELNKKLKKNSNRVQVVMVPVPRDQLIPALLDGRGDVVAAGSWDTDPPNNQVVFTTPTRPEISGIIVTGPESPPVNRIEDLAGREIYIQASKASQWGVENINAELGRRKLPLLRVRTAPELLADEDILEMVNASLVQLTITSDYVAEFWKPVFPNLVLNKGVSLKVDGQVAWLLRKSNHRLKAELNAFFAKYPEASALRKTLLQSYLKNVLYVKDATSNTRRLKFERTAGLFRKYCDTNSIDYLLMMAWGYEKSGLDQNAKNGADAIGVMQLTPATAKEMNVGDITRIGPNIHAGTKYVLGVMDRFYADKPMDRLNKALFAFASIEAGQDRIGELQKEAAALGFNPNKWFNNVDGIAAGSIGRDTVQHVANIYKYYLAYQMLAEGLKRAK